MFADGSLEHLLENETMITVKDLYDIVGKKIRLISQFFDALDSEFLNAYPDEMPVFKEGLEKEIERLIKLKENIS